MKKEKLKSRGITLIALIITIIVMLILVAVTVSVALSGGLIGKTQDARTKTEYEEDREMLLSSVIGAINNDAEVDYGKLDSSLPEGFTKAEDGGYTGKSGKTFYVDKNGNITDEKPEEGIQVTEGGEAKTITASNVAEFLGKKVTNYTGKSSVTIGSTTYNVSPEYRLYYIDFAGKYGDKNTIYLKAECVGDYYSAGEDATSVDAVNIKMKDLNPELCKDGNQISDSINGITEITWLTNMNNWANLADESMSGNINYIVGAPSLEMMIDSYNTHYKLTGDSPVISAYSEGEKRKLFYKFTNGGKGYLIGPGCTDPFGEEIVDFRGKFSDGCSGNG